MVVSAPPPSPCFTVSVVKTADGSLEAFFVNLIFCIHHDWHTQGSFCVKSGQISRGESEGIFSMVKEGKVIEVPFILRGHITSSINNQSIIKNVDLSFSTLPILFYMSSLALAHCEEMGDCSSLYPHSGCSP